MDYLGFFILFFYLRGNIYNFLDLNVTFIIYIIKYIKQTYINYFNLILLYLNNNTLNYWQIS
jgi:hypothetical protein